MKQRKKQRQKFTGIARDYIVAPAVDNAGDFLVVDKMTRHTQATIIAVDHDDPASADFILSGVSQWAEACDIAETLCAHHNIRHAKQ